MSTCLEYHLQASIELGVTEKDIRQVCQRISPRGASEGKGIGTVLKIYGLAFSGTQDPALCARGMDELSYLNEIIDRHARKAVISPWVAQELNKPEDFRYLYSFEREGNRHDPTEH